MISSWIVWLLSITVALASCFVCADAGTTLLLFAVIFIPIVAAIINRVIHPKVTLKLNFSGQCEKKETVNGLIRLHNGSVMDYRRVCVRLRLKNTLTTEMLEETVSTSLSAKDYSELEISFKSRYCGVVEISCKELRAYDFFGLTFRRLKANEFCAVTVLPLLFPVDVSLEMQGGAENVESYAEDRAGSDLSEVFEFADYTLGDSVHQIQWKLSQKHDQMIVRRGSYPLENSALLIMSPTQSNPARLSAVAETTVSIAQSLCEAGIRYKMLIWEKEQFCGYEVDCEEDLAALLTKLLSVEPNGKMPDETDLREIRHVICITDDLHRAMSFAEINAVVLLADGESQEGIICFSSKNPSEDLFEVKL